MKNITLLLILGFATQSWAKLTIHEWGTFTSFMGANGVLQEGLHHEEEKLPDFVYGVRNTQEQGISLFDPTGLNGGFATKLSPDMLEELRRSNPSSESLPKVFVNSGITQKMETPVIYFYGKSGDRVNLSVEFPSGIISQYYPRASRYSPKLKDVKTLGNSKFEFDVRLRRKNDFTGVPRTVTSSIYLPARDVPEANSIDIDGDRERFIFYRGVGNFKLNFRVSSSSGNKLTLENGSKQVVPAVFVINTDGKSIGAIKSVGAVHTILDTEVPALNKGLPYSQFIGESEKLITAALIDSGLYPKEALAFFNTWKKSYFNNPGIRVLYIVPRLETERILPMHVKQPVDELVRTLVGRVEVMTAQQEADLLKQLQLGTLKRTDLGRFFEPKLRRLNEVAKVQIQNETQLKSIDKLITSLMTHP